MNRFVSVLLLAAVIVGVIFAWRLGPVPKDVTTPESASGLTATDTDEATLGVVGPGTETAEAEAPPAMPPARLIRGGKAVEQDPANAVTELPPPGHGKADRLAGKVEKALGGDVDELIGLTRILSDCSRGMGSEEQVQQRLDAMAEAQARNPGGVVMSGRGRGGSVEYRSFEDLEATMWARFDECQVAKVVLDESLYEQVCRLAESGLPSARYLYAVWPPAQDSFITADTLELLEYQNLALEYTWMNMRAREPLGLLAMAQSYSAGRPALFTPTNFVQGQVFLLASLKCGIDNEWLVKRTVNLGRGLSRFQDQNSELPDVEGDATLLAETFCPVDPESTD